MIDHNTLRNRDTVNNTDLISRAQSDLNDYGYISATTAQALIDALIAATGGDKVFVCNEYVDGTETRR